MTIFLDILDILTTTFILYTALILLRKTRSIYILRGFFALVLFYVLAVFLNLKLTTSLFQSFVSFFIIILVIVFQKEIRRFFENFSFSFIYRSIEESVILGSDVVSIIENVANYLSKKKIGALIVLPGKQSLERLLEGGINLDGKVSEPLLLSIFSPKTPGHDGAVIIEGDMVRKFAVHLPLADNYKKYGAIGTRHRAGLGLAERTDALTIIISEERGTITMAKNNELTVLPSSKALNDEICKFIGTCPGHEAEKDNKFVSFLKYNIKDKVSVLVLSIFLWYLIAYTK